MTVLLGTATAVAQTSTGSGTSGSSTSSAGSTGSTGSTNYGTSGSGSSTSASDDSRRNAQSSSSADQSSSTSGASASDRTTYGTSGTGATGSTSTTGTTGSTSATDTAGGATTMTGRDSDRKLGWMDRRFVTKAADHGTSELKLAQLAAQQASNPEVKNFAQKLIEDHQMVNRELKSLAQQKNVKLDEEDLGSDRAYNRLSKKSGMEFDQEFIEQMVDMHEADVKMFEKASTDAKDPALKSFAAKHVDHLRQHLQRAQSLRSTIMPTGRTGDDDNRGASSTSGSSSATDSSSGTTDATSGTSRRGDTSGTSGTTGTPGTELGSSTDSGAPGSSDTTRRGGSR